MTEVSASDPVMGTNLRIDDLARAAEMPVDTIRYYAREGLLPPALKSGKNRLYGPEHLERLNRIRALQAKRFSLAAIRAILTSDRPNLDGLFLDSDHQYDLDTLVHASGLDAALIEQLLEVGLLTSPASLGRAAYDDADLALLRHVGE